MRQRLFNLLRASFLIALVALMAAASAGVFHETGWSVNASPLISESGKLQSVARAAMRAEADRAAKAVPVAQRYPPEEFSGAIIVGSINQQGGTTQFQIDRAKKTGNTFDPSQREQVTCRLENVPADQAALVVEGATVFVTGTYDPATNIFYVSRVGTTSAPPPAPAAAPAPTSTDNNDNTNCFLVQDNTDNTSTDNTSTDNTSTDNTSICSSDNSGDNTLSCFAFLDNCSDNTTTDNTLTCFTLQDNLCSDNNNSDNSSTNCFFIFALVDNNSCKKDNS